MMYFSARVRPRVIHLGFNEKGEKIKINVNKDEYIEKVIQIDRILSFAEDHMFVACPHDTVEVWDYEGDLSLVKSHLQSKGLLIV